MHNTSLFRDIAKYGNYYCPASKHYFKDSVVQCDRCEKTNLKACIGYRENDLCLTCTNQILADVPNSPPPGPLYTFPSQRHQTGATRRVSMNSRPGIFNMRSNANIPNVSGPTDIRHLFSTSPFNNYNRPTMQNSNEVNNVDEEVAEF
tara:strand:+ start:3220 stop:3663 length:444 start_codon:yes stop_codon:yes gene_type:complete